MKSNKQEKDKLKANKGGSKVSSSRESTEPPQDYEEVIQKFEGDIRKHIRIEQQMKLHSESLQQKIEDKDKEITKIQQQLVELKDEHQREKKMMRDIISEKEKQLKDQKQMYDIQSKELFEMDHNMQAPNTAKSYIDRRKSSNKTKLDPHLK